MSAWPGAASSELCVALLYFVELGDVSVEDYRAAGLPDVVIEALTADKPGAAAMSLRAEVVEARESLAKY